MKNYSLPTIALRGMTVLPNAVIHFDISRKKSIRAVEKAMATTERVFLATQSNPDVADPGIEDLFEYGTVARVKQIIKLPDGVIRVLVQGVSKAQLVDLETKEGMLVAVVDVMSEGMPKLDDAMSKAMVSGLKEVIKRYALVNPKMSKDVLSQWMKLNRAEDMLDRIVIDYPMDYLDRIHFLEVTNYEEMYEDMIKVFLEDIEMYNIKEELAIKVKEKVDKNQRDYILREQLKALSEELNGEDENYIDEYTKEVEKLNASEEIKSAINKSIKRIKMLSSSSSEASVERSYVETLLSLPWDNESEDNFDEVKATKLLDDNHYGMDKVKERILESLAVRSITSNQKDTDASIICLVGPPGTGKTSIVRSVAQALNKEYVRVCLGGVRDEAEIRGHRKTYVGAMPGRIIDGLKKVGVKNPVMLLDEIDKVSNDYRSDTASALLEVLDGEQNEHFVDHYIELPVDLSKVLFIATANDLSDVSRPLLDRMEIIEVESYTKNEKIHIAKEHLIPKQLKKNGITKKQLRITDKALVKIIDEYTKEAGVRSLERRIGKICRKVVKSLYENGSLKAIDKPVTVNDKNLIDYLETPIYRTDKINKKNEVGIVRGLAWTAVGGDTLEIEVNTMPGKGELVLTGQLGDVMKESARIALSYVRSIASDKKYGVEPEFFADNDIHIHIPEGAVPKDGPSAGVTMATALLSAVTGIEVYRNIAMTGEITLRGRVLEIGGLKEKLIAAKSVGVTKVLVPKDNETDVAKLSSEITDGLKIVFVTSMEQVISHAFVK